MSPSLRWTTADLPDLPCPPDDTRYEIIEGDLHVAIQPDFAHQYTCSRITSELDRWNARFGDGLAVSAPGIVFPDEESVAPDVTWISRDRLRSALGADGKLHQAPELVVEVLSPGARNDHRDRNLKLALYGRGGVEEYWIVDPRRRLIEQYRREGDVLYPVQTLRDEDHLQSPLLHGFFVPVATLFLDLEVA